MAEPPAESHWGPSYFSTDLTYHLTTQTLAKLRALTAAAAARASTFARAELTTAITAATGMRSILARAVGDPSANSAEDRRENRRGDPDALSAEPPLTPVSEWSAISPWNSPSRHVYRAYDLEAREVRLFSSCAIYAISRRFIEWVPFLLLGRRWCVCRDPRNNPY